MILKFLKNQRILTRTTSIKYLKRLNQGKGVFKPSDISLYVGFGGEFRINSKNTIFFGLNYSQGLFDMLNDMEYQLYAGAPESLNRNLKIKTNSFGLETGIKF